MRVLVIIALLSMGVSAEAQKKGNPLTVQQATLAISKVMMHDVVNPPAASRFYSYSLIGAYHLVTVKNKSYKPLEQLLTNRPTLCVLATKQKYDYEVAAVYCILESGRLLLPSGFSLEEDIAAYEQALKKSGLNQETVKVSIEVAKDLAKQVVVWSRGDGYFKLSTLRRYTPLKGDQYWYPTPPAYMEAVEPNWRTIRTLFLDSAQQYKPVPATPFSKDTNSKFFEMAKEVYQLTKPMTEEHAAIAAFWDCNPFAIATSGHMMLGFKKFSPGTHWINITGIACNKVKANFDKTVFAHFMVAATLRDAFISCWDEKYRSNRVRPETFIIKNIDPKWEPLLQTPPFPEYTSGHSVISSASAEVLTYIFGDNFSFTDDSEMMFELPARNFKSFRAAAQEASVSRIYGGIHYRDAVDAGVEQGKKIGEYVVSRISN
ncbi:MAG: vanadium-dependent haloperoxidase [Chitinophagaceae bacterium]|nr:vanadium-dependent haloperoxidase [Chitinophagaceae bacterium]